MKRILIVEDDVKLCLELSDMLNEFGFETGVADTSTRALNTLRNANPLPDLIILDFNMPDGQSECLCDVLQTHEEYSSITVIKMTKGEATPIEANNVHPCNSLQFAQELSGYLQ